MNIFVEIGIELVAILLITWTLMRIAYASVRIEELSIPDPNEDRVTFTREDNGMARELREEYEAHNRTAEYESGTFISLPSVTFSGVLSGLAGFVMTILVAFFHISGIAQIGIHGPVSQQVLDDSYIGTALFILPMIMLVFGVFFYWVMTSLAKFHARQYADLRVKKNRRVYICQRLSIDERKTRRKIRNAEKQARKRAEKRAKEFAERRTEVSRLPKKKSGNIIDMKVV